MTDRGQSSNPGGRRPGRHTTHEAEAYDDDAEPYPRGQSRMEPDGTGIASKADDLDGFHQPTAMFDRGEFLGELAEELNETPETRADVEVDKPPLGLRLILVAGPDIGMEWAFKQPEVTIGRGSDNEIDFSDIAVSRHHARLTLDGNGFVLTDLESNNGTLLNGVRIEREKLCTGDEIIVGARTLRFVELNEAPATAAAHPIAEPSAEPVVGSPSEIAIAHDGQLDPDARSQVDVGVVPDDDGPSRQSGSAILVPPTDKPKRTGTKIAVLGVGVLLVFAALGYMGLSVYQRLTGNTPEERARRARIEFLQGIELVKALRCGDAIILFESVLTERPEYTRAKEYIEYCRAEIAAYNQLEAIKVLGATARYDEALAKLGEIPADSGYRVEADQLKTEYRRKQSGDKIAEARKLLAAGDVDGALELVREVLDEFPGHRAARALLASIEGLRDAQDVEPKKTTKKAEIPPLMQRAVALYKKGRVSAAIDAAEAAGGPDASVYMERLRRLKGLLGEAATAHRQKAAGDLLRIAPQALDLDRKIAFGSGAVRQELKEYYADALYLKGLEAYNARDYGRAYKLLTEATTVNRQHRLSETRLAELGRKARELYYEGYVLKDSNPAETRRIFKRVKAMTPTSNQFHKWASKWLAAHGG